MVGLWRGNGVAWRWAAASEIGTSHIRANGKLEDAYAVSAIGDDGLFAIVSDGAGSAQFGRYGAWLVCRILTIRFREWFGFNSQLPSNELVESWIDDLRDQIASIAERRKSTPRQFASTLAAVLIMPDEYVTIHVGDSAIVGRRGVEWEVLCWPENGEYASTTYFVTDAPKPRLNITRQPLKHTAFALFSDGVGDLALSNSERAAHPQFFNPMIRPVDDSVGVGLLPELSRKLRTYFSEPSICERTDDDKTLILISRC